MSLRVFIVVAFIVMVSLVGVVTQRLYAVVFESSALAATFTNDSEDISVPEENLDEDADLSSFTPSPENNVPSNSGDTSDDTTDSEVVIVFDDTSESSDTQSATPSIDEVVVSSEGSSSSSNTDGSDANNTQSQNTQTIDSEEIISVLIGNQAFTQTQSTGGSGFGGGGGGSILTTLHFDAVKVREALRARGIFSLSVPQPSRFTSPGVESNTSRLTRGDFALFVSSAILQDENVSDVTYVEGELTTEYRALGRLFGVIPFWYTLRVHVAVTESGVNEVSVRFPWFSFFLGTGISRSGLEQELRTDITRRISGLQGEFDIATEVFNATASILRLRVGV